MIRKINKSNFQESIKDGICIVDFFAEWCGPCRMMSKILDEAANTHKDINWFKVNVDEDQLLSQNNSVSSIPKVIMFKDGKKVDFFEGFRSKEQINDFIKKNK